jgi:hypothetical protein
MAVPVVMAGVRVSKGEQSNHVHQKSKGADDEQFLYMADLLLFDDTFHGLPHKFDADKHQEDSIAKARQGVELPPSIRPVRAGGPLRCDCGTQADNETEAIEKHVYSIAQKTKRATQVAIDALYDHESKV